MAYQARSSLIRLHTAALGFGFVRVEAVDTVTPSWPSC